MKRPAPSAVLAILSLLCAAGPALADDAAMLKCRALPDGAARLSCYDAIPLGARAAVQPAAAAPAPEQTFGMEQVKKPESPVKSIESTIPGTFAGWGPTSLIKLGNGQVWRIADGSSADLAPMTDAKARVVRNAFGTIFLEIDGTNNSPKVRRVQ